MKTATLITLVLMLLACKHKVTPVKPLTPFEAEHITTIHTGNTTPYQLMSFACSLEGTPYKYNSTDPAGGLDCSGFVTCVFNHFAIRVPRTSADFAPVQQAIPLKNARLGDILLFTGEDSTQRFTGHMGIVSSLPGEPLRFLHSTSGKGYSVVETDFHTKYYEVRYLKTIRVFNTKTK
jgi:cell wall-associated NlpC family hydrolase